MNKHHAITDCKLHCRVSGVRCLCSLFYRLRPSEPERSPLPGGRQANLQQPHPENVNKPATILLMSSLKKKTIQNKTRFVFSQQCINARLSLPFIKMVSGLSNFTCFINSVSRSTSCFFNASILSLVFRELCGTEK